MSRLLLFSLLLLFTNCKNEVPPPEQLDESTTQDTTVTGEPQTDSVALLQLTKDLYAWEDRNSSRGDFSPLQGKSSDSFYVGLDMPAHNRRMREIEQSGLFTTSFIENYNRVANAIQTELQAGNLVWNEGDYPPFGNGASPWCNCQDFPDNYQNKFWILRLEVKGNVATYDWGFGGGESYTIKALKEGGKWRVAEMEGFEYDSYVETFQKSNDFTGKWENGMVTLNIGDSSLAFWYHGQCIYFYPVRKLSATRFEMIWAREMDCKFDNGTGETFGLTAVPQIGKPFAVYQLENNRLQVTYYYPEWVKKYGVKVADDVFTPEYSRVREVY